MTSVVTLMASALDRELRSRGLRLPTADCEQILRLVIAGPAAIGQALESSRSAMPPAEPAGGGCIGGDASAVDFSEPAIKRILTQHFYTGEPGEHGAIKAATALLAAMIRGGQPPSSAPSAPARTSDGGRTPSGAAPAVTLERVFDRISTCLNDYLCAMKPGCDDSITGFNEAWDIMRGVFRDESPSAMRDEVGP